MRDSKTPGRFRLLLPCLALLAGACAHTASTPQRSQPARPLRFAVLPFDNLSSDRLAADVARDLVRIALLKKGYDVAETAQVDAAIKNAALDSQARTLQNVSPAQLGRIVGADRLVYGFVDQFGLTKDKTQRKIGLQVRIKRAVDGVGIFLQSTEVSLPGPGAAAAAAPAIRPAASVASRTHPLRSLAAAAVSRCLATLPQLPEGLPAFPGPLRDEITAQERCASLVSMHPWLSAWAGTEADPLPAGPVCHEPTGFLKVDAFLDRADDFTALARLGATADFLRKRGFVTASNGDQVAQLAHVVGLWLAPAVQDAPGLLKQGQALLAAAPAKPKGKNKEKLAAVKAQLENTLQDLGPTTLLAKAAYEDLKNVAAPLPPAAARTIAAMAVPAAPPIAPAPRPAALPAPPAKPIVPPKPVALPAPLPVAVAVVSTVPVILPDAYYEHLDLAQGYDSVPDLPKAVAEYRAALTAAPKQLPAELGLARDLMGGKDYAGAKAAWAVVASLLGPDDPWRAYVLERQGATAARLNEIAAAKGFYAQTIGFEKRLGMSDKNQLNAYLGLAYCLARQGQRKDAIRNYQKAYSLTANERTRAGIEEALDVLHAPRGR